MYTADATYDDIKAAANDGMLNPGGSPCPLLFYLEDVKRVGKPLYELKCISAIGLLLTSSHYGGVYTGETAAAPMVTPGGKSVEGVWVDFKERPTA